MAAGKRALGSELSSDFAGLCVICGGVAKPAYTCNICGSIICMNCFNHNIKICKNCASRAKGGGLR